MLEIRRHLFLTGEKQVGKSTLLRRLIEAKKAGLRRIRNAGVLHWRRAPGLHVHGRVEMPLFENDCICCVRIHQRKSVAIPEVFDQNGVSILNASLASQSPYILMDEIGKLECSADRFCTQVLAALDGDKRVLGVLQQCDAPLPEAIKARPDVTVLTVTPENREELLAAILQAY